MLNEQEYKELQFRFSRKMKHEGNKSSHAYNEGILACKSILSELYSHNHKEGKEIIALIMRYFVKLYFRLDNECECYYIGTNGDDDDFDIHRRRY